jgi:hypothetical protein
MTQPADTDRRFSVHARHEDRHRARVLIEPSFEAAAVAYVEDLPHGDASLDNTGAEISLIVRDLDSGHEHCFRVDLETGEAAPCG